MTSGAPCAPHLAELADLMTAHKGRRAATRPRLIALLATILVLSALLRTDALAQGEHDYCGTNIPPDEAIGFVPLPEGDVFCPLIADPKSGYSFFSYVRGTSSSAFGTDLGSVGIADRFGLVRWGGPHAGDGFQISLAGAVFAQFDLDAPSFDLINADYVVGLPMTMRRGKVSARLRLYHQSSHLGDEYLLRPGVERENFAFESAEAMLSVDGGPLRLYGGGEYVFNRFPDDRETRVIHFGAELRQRGPGLRLGSIASVRVVAAGDFKAVEDLDWDVASSARAGFEISRPTTSTHVGRHWSILGHFYDGPSPYGQFFRANVRYYGVGLHFSL
jgi:hypothetical protein